MLESESKSNDRWESHRKIPSDLEVSSALIDEILGKLRDATWDDNDLFGIHMALEETLTNAIRHGNKGDLAKHVQVVVSVSPEEFEVSIEDEGEGFDPQDVPDPTAEENLDKESGRGLLLMRTFMTEVEFNQCGNAVRLKKVREKDEEAEAS